MSEPVDVLKIEVREATEDDWPWMKECAFEATVLTLGPERAARVDKAAIMGSIEYHFERFSTSQEHSTKAFVAWKEEGKRIGFIWVGTFRNLYTMEPEVRIIDLYIQNEFRGRNVGRRLIEKGEQYARSIGIKRMALSVGAHNSMAKVLYDSMGYAAETMQMGKEL